MQKERRRILSFVACAVLVLAAQAQAADKDPWLGKVVNGWDRDMGNWVTTVSNPGGIGKFREDQRCGLGNEWTEKVVAKLQPGWYVTVMTWNKPRQVPAGASWNLRTPQCPVGTLQVVDVDYLWRARENYEEKDRIRRRATEREREITAREAREAAAAAERRKLLRQLLQKNPKLALPPKQ